MSVWVLVAVVAALVFPAVLEGARDRRRHRRQREQIERVIRRMDDREIR